LLSLQKHSIIIGLIAIIKHGDVVGLQYENLDEKTRQFMIKEIELDILNSKLYIGKYLNSIGQKIWASLLKEASEKFTDDWLAGQLRINGCMETHTARRTPRGGITTARVSHNCSRNSC